jgi:hypothetical protein
MQDVLALTRTRLEAFAERPLYALLADRALSPEVRLSFVPHMAHFIMSFSDLCTLVLREEPARDRFGELVNAHAAEDCEHWRWYLHDLAQLGHDRAMTFGDALRLLWGAETRRTRMLTYRLCQLSLGASPIEKLVVILVLEATARLGFERTSQVARELGGRELVYFGGQHLETEGQHTLLRGEVQRALEHVRLDAETRRRLCEVVNRAFDAFTELVDELYESVRLVSIDRCAGG